MKSCEKQGTFPHPFPWENFERGPVLLETLRDDWLRYEMRFEAHGKLTGAGPVLDRSDVASLIPRRACSERARRELVEQLYVIAGWYLGPVLANDAECDVDSTRRQMRRMQLSSLAMAECLEHMDALLRPTFRHLHLSNAKMRAREHDLDLDYLARAMRDLSNVCTELLPHLAPRRTGRKGDFHRDTAVALAVKAIEGSGIGKVTASRGTYARQDAHFTGQSGPVVRSFFKLIDPSVPESLLVRSFLRERSRLRKEVPQNSTGRS